MLFKEPDAQVLTGENFFLPNSLSPLLPVQHSHSKGIAHLRSIYPGLFPDEVRNYIDPFLGDGSMYFNMAVERKFANDPSLELITFYELVRDKNRAFISILGSMADMWELLKDLADEKTLRFYAEGNDYRIAYRLDEYFHNFREIAFAKDRMAFFPGILKSVVLSKCRRFRQAEADGAIVRDEIPFYLESALKEGLYEHVRQLYNSLISISILKIACYYFLRRYCYCGMYRRNEVGCFTSSYAGVAVNPYAPDADIDGWFATDLNAHLNDTIFSNDDFLDFFQIVNPQEKDFIFVNPPQEFKSSTFTEHRFTMEDHINLAEYLVDHCQAQWMLFLRPVKSLLRLYKDKKNVYMNYFLKGFQARSIYPSVTDQMVLIKNC